MVANDVSTFLKDSVSGGAITAYDVSGSPVNVQLRWAKTDSSLYGGTDTWNLFYQTDSTATGASGGVAKRRHRLHLRRQRSDDAGGPDRDT